MSAVIEQAKRQPMTLVEVEQGSPEWLEWRKGGIGASEAPTIMGENPWQTPAQLWAIKTGVLPEPDLSGNPHVQRGVENEPIAREKFEETFGEFAVPLAAEHPEMPFVRASFDAILADGSPLEIKCPSPKRLEALKERFKGVPLNAYLHADQKGLQELGFGHYFAQIQQQMLVAGASWSFLYIFDAAEGKGYSLVVMHDEDYQLRLVEALREFWQLVEEGKEPEHDPERDVFDPKRLADGQDVFDLPDGHPSLRWRRAEEAYLACQRDAEALEAELKKLKEGMKEAEQEMVALMGNYLRVETDSLKITRFARKGSVDYRAAFSKYAPDVSDEALEAFRKKSSAGTRVTLVKR